ncbi:MAG TPA: glycosyltransferase [Burkholderiaceae bacterium]|nr:glycosyltransferase [Burkholderiaceae bacterium]
MTPPLVVLSHLRWDFVIQRPQHLVGRFAQERPVLFVEEPVRGSGTPRIDYREVQPGLTIACPITPLNVGGFAGEQASLVRSLLEQGGEHAMTKRYGGGGVYTFTPMAEPIIDAFAPRVVVYDCMDELSAFLNAPAELHERERTLLARADLVFTGGPSLYRAKRALHHDVHCFASSVDADHFGRALEPGLHHFAQDGLPHPRLGFYGVIDERLNIDLIAQLADLKPKWQIVMAGPIVKINPDRLPKRANLHWIGRQTYESLPALLAGWDVCLLPFALNASTRFISPTKLLEYLAAEKPVVSTPIEDVVQPYGDIVEIAKDAAGFAAACERFLSERESARTKRIQRSRAIIASTSWDQTAMRMQSLMDRVIEQRMESELIPLSQPSVAERSSRASWPASA